MATGVLCHWQCSHIQKKNEREICSCVSLEGQRRVAGTPPAAFLPSSGLSEAGHMPISKLGTGKRNEVTSLNAWGEMVIEESQGIKCYGYR